MPPADGAQSGRAAIAARQLESLRRLLAALIPANPFYRRKFHEAGVGGDIESIENFSGRFPFTTKEELVADQRAAPPFGSNLTFPLEQYTRFHQTSGTSGTPLRWLDTPASWDWMTGNWCEVLRVAGVGRADRVFCAFSFGPFIGFWLAFEAAERLGCLSLPGGGLSSSARLRVMLDTGVTVLCCTPTYAIHLGETAARFGIDLRAAKVRVIIVAGEPGGSIPATRQRIEALWPGTRVFDHHGMSEVGPVTYECPVQPGVLHVLESGHVAEIVDPVTGCAVAPGGSGELVLTNLGRTGSPLLRYRTGDLVRSVAAPRPARAAAPCRCGRFDLALAGGILGRVDDMVVVRGVNVFPSAVEEIIRACGPVAEYRVHVGGSGALPELRIELEPDATCTSPAALASRVEAAFADTLALRVPVKLMAVGALPRFEMKAERWVRS